MAASPAARLCTEPGCAETALLICARRLRRADWVKKVATLVSRSWARADSRAVQVVISPTAPAPRVTASAAEPISLEACEVWPAASWMLSAMALVVAACSCTADAMLVDTPVNSPMARAIEEISSTERLVASWMAATCAEISSVAREVWLASVFTSAATTAKPLPASPARAASMVALSASRLVCAAIAEMAPTTDPMRSAASSSERMTSWVRAASDAADFAMPSPRVDCWPISSIDSDSASVAATVAAMRCAVSAEADDADAMRPRVSSAT